MVRTGAEGFDIEVDGAVRFVSVAILDDLLDVGDDLGHVLGDASDHGRKANIELAHVLHEFVFVFAGDGCELDLLLQALPDDLVVDVSDVHDELSKQNKAH